MLKILLALYVDVLKIPKNTLVAALCYLTSSPKQHLGPTNKYMGVLSSRRNLQIFTYSFSNYDMSCWKEGPTRAQVYQSSTLVQCALRHLPSRVWPGGAAEQH